MIRVHFERNGNTLNGTDTLPPGLQGVFVWQGKEQALRSVASQIGGRQ
jgi:hypothetical protein